MEKTKTLIIGGDSFLGRNLHSMIGGECTSRRQGAKRYYYLGRSTPDFLPNADVIFLIGGITKFKECEIDPESYHINVDAQLEIAAHHARSHIVYVSSETAEWPNQTAYGSQKRACELGLMAICYGRLSVVRPSRITVDDVGDLCALLANVAAERRIGLVRWWAPKKLKALAA